MFRECFKINYKAMALELRGYTQFADHKYAQYKPKKGQKLPAPEKIVLREATDAESGRIKGELLRLGGHTTEARNALIAPYIRGEREPRLLAALGVNELASNDKVRARKFLEAAFKAGSTDSRGNIELARLRLDEALAAKPALDAAQTQQILAPLEVARVQRPPFAEAFDLIARVWMSSTLRPSAEQAKILLQGAASFPRNGALVYHAALAFSQHGYPKEARALVEHGVKAGYSENATSAFRELQSTLPSLPPTP
jgi:Flp pilus assembly protein TadD